MADDGFFTILECAARADLGYFFISVHSEHRICFTRCCLAICENSAIKASHYLFNYGTRGCIIYFLLCAFLIEDVIKGEISSFDMTFTPTFL